MGEQQIGPRMMEENRVIDLIERHLDPLLEDVRSILRTLRGEPEEGNPGMLARLQKVELRVALLVWSIPIWVTLGTGLGQVLIQWWGLG